jgi:hypothetical protein
MNEQAAKNRLPSLKIFGICTFIGLCLSILQALQGETIREICYIRYDQKGLFSLDDIGMVGAMCDPKVMLFLVGSVWYGILLFLLIFCYYFAIGKYKFQFLKVFGICASFGLCVTIIFFLHGEIKNVCYFKSDQAGLISLDWLDMPGVTCDLDMPFILFEIVYFGVLLFLFFCLLYLCLKVMIFIGRTVIRKFRPTDEQKPVGQ